MNKDVRNVTEDEVKYQKGGFVVLMATLGVKLLGNMLASKRVIEAGAVAIGTIIVQNLDLVVFIQEITYLK